MHRSVHAQWFRPSLRQPESLRERPASSRGRSTCLTNSHMQFSQLAKATSRLTGRQRPLQLSQPWKGGSRRFPEPSRFLNQ
jgi:hypothetical protein